MEMPVEILRGFRVDNKPVMRGEVPQVSLNSEASPSWWIGLLFAWFAYLGVALSLAKFFDVNETTANTWGLVGGYAVLVLCYFSPLLSFFCYVFRYRRLPSIEFFERFRFFQNAITLVALAFLLVWSFDKWYPDTVYWWKTHHLTKAVTLKEKTERAINKLTFHKPHSPLRDNTYFGIAWAITTVLLFIVILMILSRARPLTLPTSALRYPKPLKERPNLPFGLWLGQSTGKLAALSHGSGIAPHTNITLPLTDAAQNILVLGAIGAGKTTRAIHPFLIQLLDQHCGGLIFDIKGDFKQAVGYFCHLTERPVTVIGPHHSRMNLLAGLTPEIAASFLKSTFMLNGGGRQDAFWVDTATELCRNSLGVLFFLPEHYSLHGLHCYLFDDEFKQQRDDELNSIRFALDEPRIRLLNTYLNYRERIFDNFDEKVRASVNATVAQVLAPFSHPDLVDAFCYADNDSLRMESVLEGTIYVVDMPLSVWGLGGKVAYNFIKLRFFNVMQQRATRTEWNQEQPVFFMCDEYQEIVSCSKDGLSDLNFWDKSRSSKTIGIISGQSVSSFYAAIGDRDLAHALLQNFRQKLCFKTEDQMTIDLFNRLLGRVEVAKLKQSRTEGSSSHPDKWGYSHSSSETVSIDYTEKPVLDAQVLRGLGENQAVALLSIQGKSRDDILNMQPIFL